MTSEIDKENKNETNDVSSKTRTLFTLNNENKSTNSSPKRRKTSKLKQRRLKSKQQSKKIKNEQTRN